MEKHGELKMNYKTDYYKILGVHVYSDKKEIKKAYKKLAMMYHPDKNQSPSAEKKFKKINEAYSVLSDDTKRKKYDKLRASQFMKRRNTTTILEYTSTDKQHKRSKDDKIMKNVKIASDLEKDYGLISELLNLHPTGRKINSIIKSSAKNNKKSRNTSSTIDSLIANVLAKNSSYGKGHHRHRYGQNLY